MGRPLKNIDPEQVRQLALIQCTYAEMASVLKCDPSTLTKRFSQVIKEGHEAGKASLRRTMYRMAVEDKNATMAIFLAKNYMGFRDKQPDEAPIIINAHPYNNSKVDMTKESTEKLVQLLIEAKSNGGK